ncbi:MAG: ribosome biogenesis factor YjgA [Pseudomonadota bacterium]
MARFSDQEDPEEFDENVEPSKSARKRDAETRRELGRTLTRLDPKQLAALPLPDEVRKAVAEHGRMRSNGAARRQLLYLAGLLRRIDCEPIATALGELEGQSRSAKARLHALERWRERLLVDSAALTEYLNEHPQTDRQALRNLLAKVRKAPADSPKHTAASRELFRFLRADANHDQPV